MVKYLTHGLRGFNGVVQRRLATLLVIMLISSCWQLSSEVELRRFFDVCKRWTNSGSHEFVMKNMVRYIRPHVRFAHCSCRNSALTVDLGLSASAAGSCCIFTLAVRQLLVLASCIEIYYFKPVYHESEKSSQKGNDKKDMFFHGVFNATYIIFLMTSKRLFSLKKKRFFSFNAAHLISLQVL